MQDNYKKNRLQLYAEKDIHDIIKAELEKENKHGIKNDLKVFDSKNEEFKLKIRFIITFGGDGTILYAAKSFHGNYIPPIISFSLVHN